MLRSCREPLWHGECRTTFPIFLDPIQQIGYQFFLGLINLILHGKSGAIFAPSLIFSWEIASTKIILFQIYLGLSQISSQITPENLKRLRLRKISQFWGLLKWLSEIWAFYGQFLNKVNHKTFLWRKYFDLGILWFSIKNKFLKKFKPSVTSS